MSITSSNPPIKLIAPANGEIINLFFDDGDEVKENQLIAIINNPAKTRGVFTLKSIVDALNDSRNLKKTIDSLSFPEHMELGEINSNYVNLIESIKTFKFIYNKTLDKQGLNKRNKNDVQLNVRNISTTTSSKIAGWVQKYAIQSPVSGKLTFFWIRQINQYVKSGEPVFTVVPPIKQYRILVKLPTFKAGKIKIGQRVLIKLDEYPFSEFGGLTAKISSVSSASLNNFYDVELKLENGFLTTRNKKIDPKAEINGIADIKTNDKSILGKIYDTVSGKLDF